MIYNDIFSFLFLAVLKLLTCQANFWRSVGWSSLKLTEIKLKSFEFVQKYIILLVFFCWVQLLVAQTTSSCTSTYFHILVAQFTTWLWSLRNFKIPDFFPNFHQFSRFSKAFLVEFWKLKLVLKLFKLEKSVKKCSTTFFQFPTDASIFPHNFLTFSSGSTDA